METSLESRRNELTVVPYSSAGWNVVLYPSLVFPGLMMCRQNSVGNVVLFNRRHNQIQLSTNVHSLENGVEQTTSNNSHGVCPTCHRPIQEGDGPQQHSPAFMDSEYFRLLSSTSSDLPSVGEGDRLSEDAAAEERPAGSLPRSAFNQGYFEQYDAFRVLLIKILCCSVRVGKRGTWCCTQSNSCT